MPQTIPQWPESIRDTPIIGDWIGDIGKIRILAQQPCDPGAYIAAYAFWVATPMVIWSLFGPDCIDLVDERRGRRRKRRRGIRWRDGHAIPYPGKGGGWGWRVWRLGDLAQKAGWYLAVIDATLDFYVHSSSLAMQFSGCAGAGNPYAFLDNTFAPHNLLATAIPLPLTWGSVQDHIFIAGGNDVIVPQGNSWASYLDYKIEPAPGFPPATSVQIDITDIISGAKVFSSEADPTDTPGQFTGGGFTQGSPLLPAAHLETTYTADERCIMTGFWRVGGFTFPEGGFIGTGCASLTKINGTHDGWWTQWINS